MGTGLSVSQNIPENGNGLPLSELPDVMIFQVWRILMVLKYIRHCARQIILIACGNYKVSFDGSGDLDTSWHEVRIEYLHEDNHYEVYLDDNYVPFIFGT